MIRKNEHGEVMNGKNKRGEVVLEQTGLLEPAGDKLRDFARALGYDLNYCYALVRMGKIRVNRFTIPGNKRETIRVVPGEYRRFRGL